MKPLAIDEVREPPERAESTGVAARFWLRKLFWIARRFPWSLRIVRPVVVCGAVCFSGHLRRGTFANARRILGEGISRAKCFAFAIGVVGSFYDFVVDAGRSGKISPAALRSRIESIEGHEEYLATRRQGRGAILLTAHMGSFELGLAALADIEPNIHVVFKRDALGEFEIIRRTLRETLGIHEAAIDDGWDGWSRLRDVLENNHVVVMQGDRAMPGQKSQLAPMFGAHLALPVGPIKLAQISGSPIIPVFVPRTKAGRFKLCVRPAIHVDPDAALVDGVHPQLLQWAKEIEQFVREYPRQWIVLEPAFAEDAVAAT